MGHRQNNTALKELLYRIADDLLILGHRNSEWTGIGPLLEEDIAFSSMAQDKIGQSLVVYQLLQELGEADPDTVAFTRNAQQFHNCQLVELPGTDYEFSLVRHFLYDHSLLDRFRQLTGSGYQPLAAIAKKFMGELRYHVLHADTFIKKLGTATDESKSRMQKALNHAIPFALGIFEKSPFEQELITGNIFVGEAHLFEIWQQEISKIVSDTDLELPDLDFSRAKTGGRTGKHTEHLQPLLEEMSEVFKLDPGAEW